MVKVRDIKSEHGDIANTKGWEGIVVYIKVDNVEATLEKVKMAGGEVVQGTGKPSWEVPRLSYTFRDTEGNLVGLTKELRL